MITRRHSALRTEILNLLRQHHLLSAAQISTQLSQQRRVNKTSVYRALEILLEQGSISRQSLLPDGETQYELSEQHHDHFVCTRCGRVTEIRCSIPAPSVPADYLVETHRLTLYGQCRNCRGELDRD